MEVSDFTMLIENTFEIPYIDEAFYRAFCGGKSKNITKSETSTVTARRNVVQKILKQKNSMS